MQENIIPNGFNNKHPKVTTIILNWNGKEDTIECLESLKHITYPNYEILLVDNGSTDGSVESFRERYPGMEIIENGENLGFAEGNNVGIRRAMDEGADYVLLLNNDMIIDKKILSEFVKIADNNPQVGVITPKVYSYYDQNTIQFTWAKINLWTGRMVVNGANRLDVGQFEQVKEVDYGHGGCSLIKREVIEIVGLLDTEFFLYHEDMDYWIRVRSKGYKIIYTPLAKVWHKGGSTSRKSGLYYYYSVRSLFLFMGKHATSPQLVSFILWFFCFEFWIITRYRLIHKQNKELLSTYRGIIDGIFKLVKHRLKSHNSILIYGEK